MEHVLLQDQDLPAVTQYVYLITLKADAQVTFQYSNQNPYGGGMVNPYDGGTNFGYNR